MRPLPYRFPDHRELIFRDAQRVQQMAPPERLDALLEFLTEGESLSAQSPNREAAERLRSQQRAQRRKLLRELLAKHGL